LGALAQQTVLGIDSNIKQGAFQMAAHHVAQPGKNHAHGVAVASNVEIAIECMKKPKGRVRGVIESLVLPIGKKIWNHAVPTGMRKSAQDPTRFEMSPRGESKPLEADHR